MSIWPWFLASYLVGAIPTSWLIVKLVRGQDLRALGSGNLGATNLYRVLGLRYALPVGVVDLLKGVVPVAVFGPRAGDGPFLPLLLGLTAVAGHIFSVFVKFRGGKGVATGAGVVLGLAPWAFLAVLGVWLLLVRATGYVSLGSMVGALILPGAVWLLHPERRDLVGPLLGLALVIVVLHRANIRRLLAGTEHRFGRRGPAPGEAA